MGRCRRRGQNSEDINEFNHFQNKSLQFFDFDDEISGLMSKRNDSESDLDTTSEVSLVDEGAVMVLTSEDLKNMR